MVCGLSVGGFGGNYLNHPTRKWELLVVAIAVALWIIDFKSIFAHWRVKREEVEKEYEARIEEIRKRYG